MYVKKKKASMEGRDFEEENCNTEEKDMIEDDGDDNDNDDTDDDCNDEGNEIGEGENHDQIQPVEAIEAEKNVKKKVKKTYDVTDPNFVRLRMYRTIFEKNFNLSFYKPKKDR